MTYQQVCDRSMRTNLNWYQNQNKMICALKRWLLTSYQVEKQIKMSFERRSNRLYLKKVPFCKITLSLLNVLRERKYVSGYRGTHHEIALTQAWFLLNTHHVTCQALRLSPLHPLLHLQYRTNLNYVLSAVDLIRGVGIREELGLPLLIQDCSTVLHLYLF